MDEPAQNMDSVKAVLLAVLALVAAGFLFVWFRSVRRGGTTAPRDGSMAPTPAQIAIGFVTNFFDTLGIGSFATTTSIFRLWRVVPDERIPGTLNVGHAPPVIVQAFIFVAIIQVDVDTLLPMIAAAVAGAWLGAGIVADLPRRHIQLGIGLALLLAAGFFVMSNLGWFPAGGEALRLDGWRLWVGVIVNCVLGALNTLGIGLYAPCITLVSLLGMNPKAAFPIMMGSCAFLMPVGSVRFVQKQAYSLRPALGLMLGGIPAVLIAAFLVKSLPITTLRWLVAVVLIGTAWAMLRSAVKERSEISRE